MKLVAIAALCLPGAFCISELRGPVEFQDSQEAKGSPFAVSCLPTLDRPGAQGFLPSTVDGPAVEAPTEALAVGS